MTMRPQDFTSADAPLPEKDLRAIRAALVVPEDREAFDAGLKAVLDEVRVSLDLAGLDSFVHRWWISACDSLEDPGGRRQMHVRVQQAQTGEPIARGRVWREILAARGVDA
ncbi:DUF6247 family protein [Bailinhaonella thermotolerans]|uniref:Uncharacterized protein n=1 Tax=Bailinhaonella thermotolerans TaxID=1070861 RepID=A0A3A4AB62_9ACTN|nr:DUF6247 family protein [Bailinhaonella thermotolerans]RJL23290.1 hypothetical protein D5H75_33560 [Bailinhaonella thermotolerans]